MEKRRPADGSASGEQPCPAEVSDAELLGRFVSQRDESAFAALMARHGPMVYGVCRQGTWTEVAVERYGKREKKAKERAKQLVFRGDKILIKEKGKEFEGSFKLDPKQNPKTIDTTVKDLQIVQQGIYRLEGDTLTVSFSKKERPREFDDAGDAITIFKREPPKK